MSKFNLNQLLSNTSLNSTESDAIEGARPIRTAYKVIPLSVHDLIPSKDNFYSVEDIEDLKSSIDMFGVKQNLTVKPKENGKYEILAGHRRRLACLALVNEGKTEYEYLPCAIETELDEIREKLLLIMTNSTTRQLSDWEKTQQSEELRKLFETLRKREKIPGRTRDLIAEALNTSAAQVGRMDAISKNLVPEFKEEFKEKRVGMSTAYELSGLPEEKQKEAFVDYKEKGNLTINNVKEKKRICNLTKKSVVPECAQEPQRGIEEVVPASFDDNVDTCEQFCDICPHRICGIKEKEAESKKQMVMPEIVCLCGSTRFYKTFDEQNFKFTLEGKIILGIGCNTKSDKGLNLTADDKIRLDELHKRKIDLCDSVFVLNVGGYFGESTRSEIKYAQKIGKPIKYLEDLEGEQ